MTLRTEVCICGHGDYQHNFVIRNFTTIRTNCEHCQCPEFELIGNMTWEEWEDYKRENEIKM